ncbi:MAG TPA: 3-dehydroquinate synthase [Steroidobacteraceae bacterium]|jgi:3-dehydroquinate synthase|nr:3-dehydroquinate synthase [Steroidobacteraceae bacterium]
MSFGARALPKLRIIDAVQTLQVDLGHTRYPIAIGPGLLTNRELLEAHIRGRDLLIVTNTTVARLYLAKLTDNLASKRVAECILPDGEQHKTLQTAGWVFDALVGQKMNRDATVLALGGGVVGDIAGFVAACYQRGVGYVQLPTTLLAQVDSSVGGKTGVNHAGGKNLIGAFYQPLGVIADTDTLATLPDRELSAGLAEVIKYGCVWDPLLFDWLDNNVDLLVARDVDALTYAIGRSCEIKATVVAKDEREQNLRAILNFGHTFGHAIEAATAYEIYLHGEAVGLGMLMAASLSHRLGLIDAGIKDRLRDLLTKAGLPTEAPRVGAAKALELMHMDKKVLAGSVRLVLLEKLGRAIVTSDYSQAALDETLAEFLE